MADTSLGTKCRAQLHRKSFYKEEECFRGPSEQVKLHPTSQAMEPSRVPSPPLYLLFLSSSCSVYTMSSAPCVLALLSPHLSFRLCGPAAAHSSLGGKGGNGRVFALMNWLNGPAPISFTAWILILEKGKEYKHCRFKRQQCLSWNKHCGVHLTCPLSIVIEKTETS